MKLQIDKMAHFGIGGTITAIFTLISILQEGCPSVKVILLSPIIGHVCTFILSYIKSPGVWLSTRFTTINVVIVAHNNVSISSKSAKSWA